MTGKRATLFARIFLIAGLFGLIAIPASGAGEQTLSDEALQRLSGVVQSRYYARNPAQASQNVRAYYERMQAIQAMNASSASVRGIQAAPFDNRFNEDVFGLPQNEESVSVCRRNTNVVLGGTNDYRGLLSEEFNFTGWHLSMNGGDVNNDTGNNVTNEGLLPEIDGVPSGGDPVDVAVGDDCDLYAGSLNYDPFEFFPNGIGVYKTTPQIIANCDTSNEPFQQNEACWPERRLIASAPDPTHFLDKEWLDVGDTGDGRHVWVVYSDFSIPAPNPAGFTSKLMAVRCDGDLNNCTAPINISGTENDIQFGDVTIGADGRTYITWAAITGELQGTPQKFRIELRVIPQGSTVPGPKMVVAEENKPIPFGGFLHANDFRVATYPKNEVVVVDDQPRIFVTWDACRARPLGSICEEPQIKLAVSNDFGRTWQRSVISNGGDNYFPSIARDAPNNRLAVAYFTNRYDDQYHNAQDVDLVTLDVSGAVLNRQRLTIDFATDRGGSNETEADPLLGGIFIGDYIEVFSNNGTAYVHYNMNIHDVCLLCVLGLRGSPVPQQDNFLTKRGL